MSDQKFIMLLQDAPGEPWRPQILDETGLSRFFEMQHYAPEPYPYQLKWASETGHIWTVTIDWTTTPYDRDDYSDTIGVLKAAGMRRIGQIGFRVDGRA